MSAQALDARRCALFACALAPREGDVAARFLSLPLDEEALRIAQAHQIRPQAAPLLGLQELLGASRGRGLMMSAELLALLDALEAAGIRAVPFKGPAFAALVADGPALREMTDLDLLVDARDIPAAAAALIPLGYESALPRAALASPWIADSNHELALFRPADTMLVELHWRLGPAWFPAPCSLAEVFASLHAESFCGRAISWPHPAALLLAHVADGMKSGGRGIRWIADVARILRRGDIDWAWVRSVAGKHGGLGVVAVALAALDAVCTEVATSLDQPSISLPLPPAAADLAHAAHTRPRLAWALRALLARLASDAAPLSALQHFRWAAALSDRRVATAGAVARYLLRPATADLERPGAADESNARQRWNALSRRVHKVLHPGA